MWRARLLLLLLVSVPVAIAAVIGVAVGSGGVGAVGTAAVSVTVVASFAVVLHGRYRSWRYAERDEDLLVQRGLMVRKLSVVPYGRMQFVDVTAGPIDRLFGLATVQLHTAAAATDARVPGLARPEAERLRDRLAALGEARAAGL
jgi:membrane protein YdbS with pleckstrin-like domain